MVRPVPIEEAFGDSPAFHARLQASENALNNVDSSIKKMVHVAEKIAEMTKDYSGKYQNLAEEIEHLGESDDDPAYEAVGLQLVKIAQVIKDIERSRLIAAVQYKDVLVDPLQAFASKEIHPTKKAGKEFQSAQDGYHNALTRYMSKRPTDKGLEESSRDVAEARKGFHAKTVEYATKLNDTDVKRKFELVENIVALIYTNFSFFHQAYDALKDIEPCMRDLTAMLQKMRQDHSQIDTNATAEFMLQSVRAEEYDPTTTSGPKAVKTASTIYKGSYLYKKSSSKMRTVWHRRYFELINNHLHYFSLEGKDEAKTTIDLRICAVKETPAPERRFCFDLVSPSKAMTLQAQSEDQLKDWMNVLQAAIARSISDEGFTVSQTKPTFGEIDQAAMLSKGPPAKTTNELMKKVLAVPGNDRCADCGSQDDVEWVSCNLGIILCITCSGIHRGLGRHVSKMKSLGLDRWDQESGDILLELGNEKVNAIYEGKPRLDGTLDSVKPSPSSDRAAKQKYCVAKYANKEYLLGAAADPELHGVPLQSALVRAMRAGDILMCLRCIACGANVNEKDLNGQSLLHHAVTRDNAIIADFLLQWNAEINVTNSQGRTPLHLAAEGGHASAVLALLRRNAKSDIKDNDGKVAAELAEENSDESERHARVVGLLRMTDSTNKAGSAWKSQDWGDHPISKPGEKSMAEKVDKVSDMAALEGNGWSVEPTTTKGIVATEPWSTPSSSKIPLPSQGGDPWAEEQQAWS
ncbi:hypothetical protein DFS34DRAFT_630350 [Phlyctochytrium arcticum]|nr:hypothetical protein DFS34DRAFT_630350 [Phlyctochytrium arcticum]